MVYNIVLYNNEQKSMQSTQDVQETKKHREVQLCMANSQATLNKKVLQPTIRKIKFGKQHCRTPYHILKMEQKTDPSDPS